MTTGKKSSSAKRGSVTTRSTTKRVVSKRVSGRVSSGKSLQVSAVVSPEDKLDRLVEGFGNNKIAELLDVSRSQPSRWRSRKEGIASENERRVVDLEYVMSRLLRLYPRDVAQTWLLSHNAHLGSRPIEVLKLSGALPVIEAIDAEEQGAFA
jgi:hypothetical protein